MNDYAQYAYASPTMSESLADRRRAMIERCTQAAKRIGKPIVFGMTTALVLLGLPMPNGCDLDTTALHTVCINRNKRIRSVRQPVMHAHIWKQLDASRIRRINRYVYAVDPEQLWAQLAAHVPFDQLIMLGDAIITLLAKQSGSPPENVHRDFVAFVNGLKPFHGKTRCLRAVTFVMPNVASPKETETRLTTSAHGIPTPITNYVVPNATFASGAPMTLDLAWPEYRVAVEYDGDQHRTSKAQWRTDQEKREKLRALGWTIVIVTAATLADEPSRAEFAWRVARHLDARGARFTFSVSASALD